MKAVDTIKFTDFDEGEARAIVRASEGFVGLAISILDGNDIEVCLPTTDAEKVADALARGIQIAKTKSSPR